jgi:hypothetical protein
LSSRHRTHDPYPVVRGSASAVVAAAYNQSGTDYIAYARQCRAFGLTLPSLRDKDKMWRETLLGAIWLSGTRLKSAILAHCLNAESPSTAGIRRHAKPSCG